MTNEKMQNIIKRLKEVKERDSSITIAKIADHTGVSHSTVTRMFSDKSDDMTFRYESVRPVAEMLLGLDSLDEGEDDEKALKAIIQYKDTLISQLREQIEAEKEKHDKKLDKERSQSRTSIDFLKHQIELKDERITRLMEALDDRNEQYKELNKLYLEAMGKLLKQT